VEVEVEVLIMLLEQLGVLEVDLEQTFLSKHQELQVKELQVVEHLVVEVVEDLPVVEVLDKQEQC
jgi:hypothetical protein